MINTTSYASVFYQKRKKNELKPKMGGGRDQVSYITFSILHLTLLCKQQKKFNHADLQIPSP